MATSTAIERTSLIASRFGLADLLLGKCGAAGDIFFGLLVRVLGDAGRFALGGGDDVGRFLLRLPCACFWIFGEQLLGLFAQSLRLVQLVADLGGAVVERLGHHARHLQVDDDRRGR